MNNQDIILLLVYAIGFILVLYSRSNEWLVLCVLATVAAIVIIMLPQTNWKRVILLTILFGTVENICVYYGLWKYNVKYPMPFVPLWLYIAWFLSIIFIGRYMLV
jgi:hypothetical protein